MLDISFVLYLFDVFLLGYSMRIACVMSCGQQWQRKSSELTGDGLRAGTWPNSPPRLVIQNFFFYNIQDLLAN